MEPRDTLRVRSEEDSSVEVLHTPEEVQKIKDSLDSNQNLDENYILIPTKLPFKVFALIVIHTIVLIIGGTIFYSNVITKLEEHGKKLERLENGVYSKDQVETRIDYEIQGVEHRMLSKRFEELKETSIRKKE